MRPTPLSAILTLTLAAAAPAMAASLKDVAPYPEAEKGYTRQVIHLPAQADESAYKLEILAGKTLKVDCNHQRLAGSLEERTLEGWGYNYYELGQVGPAMSTIAASRGTSATVARFSWRTSKLRLRSWRESRDIPRSGSASSMPSSPWPMVT